MGLHCFISKGHYHQCIFRLITQEAKYTVEKGSVGNQNKTSFFPFITSFITLLSHLSLNSKILIKKYTNFSVLKKWFYLFWEGKGGRETSMWKRNANQSPLTHSLKGPNAPGAGRGQPPRRVLDPWGTLPAISACRTTPNPLSHTSQGLTSAWGFPSEESPACPHSLMLPPSVSFSLKFSGV